MPIVSKKRPVRPFPSLLATERPMVQASVWFKKISHFKMVRLDRNGDWLWEENPKTNMLSLWWSFPQRRRPGKIAFQLLYAALIEAKLWTLPFVERGIGKAIAPFTVTTISGWWYHLLKFAWYGKTRRSGEKWQTLELWNPINALGEKETMRLNCAVELDHPVRQSSLRDENLSTPTHYEALR